jgi:hypothetical protein
MSTRGVGDEREGRAPDGRRWMPALGLQPTRWQQHRGGQGSRGNAVGAEGRSSPPGAPGDRLGERALPLAEMPAKPGKTRGYARRLRSILAGRIARVYGAIDRRDARSDERTYPHAPCLPVATSGWVVLGLRPRHRYPRSG